MDPQGPGVVGGRQEPGRSEARPPREPSQPHRHRREPAAQLQRECLACELGTSAIQVQMSFHIEVRNLAPPL